MLDTISIFLNLLRFDLWPKMWSILEYVPCVLEKMFPALGMSWRYQWDPSHPMYHVRLVFPLIFCFDDLSNSVSGVLKSPTIIVLLQSLLLCLLVFVLCIEVLCWMHRYLQLYVFLLDWSLDYYVVSFLISWNILYFKVCFVWYQDCYYSFLLLPICMEYIFPSSHFQSYVSLGLKWVFL